MKRNKQDFKKKIFDALQLGDNSTKVSVIFDIVIISTIIANIIALCLETFDELAAFYPLFTFIEVVTTSIFCIEYILRIWTADMLYPDKTPGKARLKFLYSFDGIIDLLTIIPAMVFTGFVVFRMLRVVRILQLFRINATYDSFHVITTVIKEKWNQIATSIFIILILMLSSSLCIYSVEHEAQPEVFSNAFSGIWWAISTIFTIGYGDIYPITVLGRILAIVLAFLGVGVVAIPTGIISAGFVEIYTKDQGTTNYKNLDISDIVEILADNKMARRTVKDISSKEGLEIYLILRNGMTIVPKDDTVIRNHDIIVAKITKNAKNP